MKITKKSFIEAMVNNNSSFIGITRSLLNKDEVYCVIQDILKPDVILEKRSCTAYSRGLRFSGNNVLGFDQYGKYEFFEYTYPEAVVYICCHSYYDEFDKITRVKAMHYLIKK